MPSKNNRLWVLLPVVAGLIGLGYFAYSAFRDPSLPNPASSSAPGGKPAAAAPGGPPGGFPLPVETVRLVAADLALDATAVGSLRSNESVVLRPETAGRIATIGFKDGAAVSKGALLVGLDAATQSAEFDQAKANFELARANQQRTRDLFDKKFISQQALDNTDAALKVQEALVALAKAKLDKMSVRAPFAGVVGIRTISVGDYVKEGQDLINLEDISRLKIDFRMPETYLGQLKPGQKLEISSDTLPGQRFEALLEALNPLLDAGGRAISCRAALEHAGSQLRPGMFVRVRLLLEQRKQALLIPEQALVPDSKAPFVYRVLDGKALRSPVKTGLRRNAHVEIVEGLNDGDEIVTAGQLKLRDGAAVKVLAEGGAAPTNAQATVKPTGPGQ
jgi:membrane fusion protein (multidrug efflux system)